jgi:flagellin-like hook-associated protein FlgL
VLLGNGDGTFRTRTVAALGGDGATVATADFNGDGVLDLAAGTIADGNVRILIGRGDGTFNSTVSLTTDDIYITSLAIGDINGDGDTDMIAGGYSPFPTVTIFLGNGNGTFTAGVSFEVGGTFGLGLADLNGDGNLDLFSGGAGSIALGRGDGTFGTVTTVSGGSEVGRAADFNRDGVLDLLMMDGSGEMIVHFASTRNGVSPLLSFKLTSRADALQALSQFGQALNRLSTQRGIIGAFQSRITVAGNVLQTSTENFAAAAGRIKDSDLAEESSRIVRTQILQQAASAVLAQANQQPALAITLLTA